MPPVCISCKDNKSLSGRSASDFPVTGGICPSCAGRMFSIASPEAARKTALESIDAPVLLMRTNPRLVMTANSAARELFDKKLSDIECLRGGQVFDCVHSYSELGCGMDINCANCKVKGAVTDTFTEGRPFVDIATSLMIKKNDVTVEHRVKVSTESVGDFVLLRMDEFARMEYL